VLCANWTGLTPDTTLDCLLPMLRAGSCGDLEEAVRHWVIPANSLLTADTAGDISFRIRGRIIERPPANRWTPVPGDDAHAWDGLMPVPFDDLQHVRNPDRGFLVTANNRVSDQGPYISLDFAPPSRHNRIVELLDGITGATVNDMTAIHADVLSLFAAPICRVISDLRPSTDLGHAARDLVAAWDHQATVDSAAAVVYSTFRQAWASEVDRRIGARSADLGEAGWPREGDASRMLLDASTTLLVDGGWELVPGIETATDLASILNALLDRSAADLAERWGHDPATWRWDDQHIMLSPHPLAVARPEAADLAVPVSGVPGDGETVRAGGVATIYGLRSYLSSVARYVFDVADWDNSGWIVPHGVSGVRGSGHDLDQRDAWLACDLIPMAYSDEAVAANAVTTHTVDL
jgi:penicillin amidase